ncbi:hypothetical protein DMH04_54850 [Kibdelosporangium aridum]|uniref:Cryptochrome/DNA photolyase FAD-binding domain-containing protein n=2 Tax=Kibdelosporangium aridum TaxID=2030 RepID=A0A428XXG8_KIBAR|nr:hypothetical protein DMH04_54850 [Kibdelosporangium aridum]
MSVNTVPQAVFTVPQVASHGAAKCISLCRNGGHGMLRRFVPELRGVPGKRVHKPWEIDGLDYPKPMVDHAYEREVALARYNAIKN